MTRKIFVVFPLFLAFIILLYGSRALAHTPSPPICNDATCNIDLQGNSFIPSDITIRPPNTVTGENVTIIWQNHDFVPHTVTSGTRNVPDGIFDRTLSSGEVFQLQITESLYNQFISRYPSGVIPYYCRLHDGMDGTLRISGEPIPEFSFLTFLLAAALMSGVLLLTVRYAKRK